MSDIMDPIVIQDAAPRLLFNRACWDILHGSFDWHFLQSTAYSTGTLDDPSFVHSAIFDGMPVSKHAQLIEALVVSTLSRTEYDIAELIRVRVGMVPRYASAVVHAPHVDMDRPHLTGLLYINESDGDTILYKEKFTHIKGLNAQDFYELELNQQLTENIRISPQPNKLVIFDGLTYHSSVAPTVAARRIVINFNFVPK